MVKALIQYSSHYLSFTMMFVSQEGKNSLGSEDGALVQEEIDNSNGVVSISYDPDTSVIYLIGKVVS